MRRQLNPVVWSLLFLVVACAGAYHFALRMHERNERLVQTRLEELADESVGQLQKRFQFYEYGLRAARGAVIGAGNRLTRDGFRQYAESRDFEAEFPGSHGFGYIARVAPGQVAAFVANARKDRGGNFKLRQLAPHAGDRFIIEYIEPEALNAEAVGLDIASEDNRRTAALAAMASGKATLSGPITLVQASGLTNRSMLFLLPVYRGDQVRPPDSREQALEGWVYTPLITNDILADFDQTHAQYGFRLTDVTDASHPEQFFASHVEAGPTTALERSRTFPMFGRQWRVDILASPHFVRSMSLPDPTLDGLWIVGSIVLLTIVLFVLLTASRRRQRGLAQRARLATIVEDSREAIIGTSLLGVVTEWNRAARDYFGYDAAEAIGQRVIDLIVPQRRIEEQQALLKKVLGGDSVSISETVRRHRDGSTLYVEISASPIRDGRGRVVGAAETMRDITARKESQRKILEMNATLEQQVQQRTAELQAFSSLQRAILNNAGYAIIATDPEGTITLFNPAAESMLGYRSQRDGRHCTTPGIFHDPEEIVARAAWLARGAGRHVKPVSRPSSSRRRTSRTSTSGPTSPSTASACRCCSTSARCTAAIRRGAGLSRHRRGPARAQEARGRTGDQRAQVARAVRAVATGYRADRRDGPLRRIQRGVPPADRLYSAERTARDRLLEADAAGIRDARNGHCSRIIEQTGRYGPYEKEYLRAEGERIPGAPQRRAAVHRRRPTSGRSSRTSPLQRMTESAMVEAVAAAEAASAAKSDFLANMSHEIRTPMNAILGMLQLLQRTGLDATPGATTAARPKTPPRTLLAILNDILDFSKIEAGRQTLESSTISRWRAVPRHRR